jgi:hypothetical protein
MGSIGTTAIARTFGLATMLWALTAAVSSAATVTYTNSGTFLAALGSSVTDDYSAPGYAAGDVFNGAGFDIHTDLHMSAVLGETDYVTTGFPNLNEVGPLFFGNPLAYCAGCSGSFRLTFTSTSVGDATGVYGVGFQFANLSPLAQFNAFVTFGDNSTANYVLPATSTTMQYFGIASDVRIQSIHLGLAGGAATILGAFVLDDLTIGAPTAVPLPAALWLLLSGLAGVVAVARRRLPQPTRLRLTARVRG